MNNETNSNLQETLLEMIEEVMNSDQEYSSYQITERLFNEVKKHYDI